MHSLFLESEYSLTTFDNLGLADSLLRAVRDEGYDAATPIQLQAIPIVLAQRNLMGCARREPARRPRSHCPRCIG